MKRLLPIILFLNLIILEGFSQHNPQYSQFMLNNFLVNPAIAGIEEFADVKLGYRHQWTNVVGAPVTQYVTAHMPIGAGPAVPVKMGNSNSGSVIQIAKKTRLKPHHGVGFTITNDKTGSFRRFKGTLAYAYHLPLGKSLMMSMGGAMGINQYSLDMDKVVLANPNDQLIGAGMLTRKRFDLSMGTWIYSSQYYFGISVNPQFGKEPAGEEPLTYPGNMNMFLTAGTKINLSSRLDLVPSVLLKYLSPSPVSVDVVGKVIFNSRFFGGMAYRSSNSMVVFVGGAINHLFDVSYSYDYGLGGVGPYTYGNHEIMLSFRLKNTRKVLCPEQLW